MLPSSFIAPARSSSFVKFFEPGYSIKGKPNAASQLVFLSLLGELLALRFQVHSRVSRHTTAPPTSPFSFSRASRATKVDFKMWVRVRQPNARTTATP
jgi:hypothetical protein